MRAISKEAKEGRGREAAGGGSNPRLRRRGQQRGANSASDPGTRRAGASLRPARGLNRLSQSARSGSRDRTSSISSWASTPSRSVEQVVDELRACRDAYAGAPAERRSGRRARWISTFFYIGSCAAREPDLTLPRPDLLRRAYMLGPLAEIAPSLKHPVSGQSISVLWESFDRAAHPLEPVTHPTLRPPSTARIWPVDIQGILGKNTAARATSSGVPMRLSAVRSMISCFNSGSRSASGH